MLLAGKNAVIYGGAGNIGGAVARAFAREGAQVFLVGRTASTLDAVAEEIRGAGGKAETAVADAMDEQSVAAHADAVVAAAGSLDITLNVINHGDVQGTPLVEMSIADVEAPVLNGLRTNLVTVKAAARHMIRQRSGVMLFFGGEGDPLRDYDLGGLQIGFQAIEALRRQLAAELGRHGIRTVSLQTSGIVDSIPADMEGAAEIVDGINASTLLGRAATLADVGNAAVFAASDWGRTLTGTKVNISCGSMYD
jgi:NAD(P)-dependent dehydrogenase (short-subunit alcohol dehydrogenase family)